LLLLVCVLFTFVLLSNSTISQNMLKIPVILLIFATLCLSNQPGFVTFGSRGPRPIPGKEGGSLVGLNNVLYQFGGNKRCFNSSGEINEYDTDIFSLDIHSHQWTQHTVPNGPGQRAYSAIGYNTRLGVVILYGGAKVKCPFDAPTAEYADLWYFHPHSNTWTLKASGTGPGVRIGTGHATVGDRFYIWGGLDAGFNGHNDLWYWDTVSETFVQAHPGCSDDTVCPHPRFNVPFEYNERHNVFVMSNGDQPPLESIVYDFSDMWIYNLASGQWSRKLASGQGVSERTQSVAWTKDDYFFVALGDKNDGPARCENTVTQWADADTAEIWRINFRKPGDTFVDVTAQYLGDLFPIKGCSAVNYGNSVWVTGGHWFICPSAGHGFPLINNEVYQLSEQ